MNRCCTQNNVCSSLGWMIIIRRDRCFLLNIAGIIKLAERAISSCSICKIGFGKAFGSFHQLHALAGDSSSRRDRVSSPGGGSSSTIWGWDCNVHLSNTQNNGPLHHGIEFCFCLLIFSSTSNPFPARISSALWSHLWKTDRKSVIMRFTFGSRS